MTGKIKLVHSGGNAVSLAVPTSNPSSSEVELKLPQSDGSADTFLKTDGSGNLSFAAVGGITMADQWRVTSDFNVTSFAFITSNWERNDSTGYGKIGTGMSESSGEFSFPSTGIYLVRIVISWYASGGGVNYNRVSIQTTTDNSTYASRAFSWSGVESSSQYNNMTAEILFDVTDVSTHKVKFQMGASNTRPIVKGGTDDNRSYATFIRLGDT
tara:strand:+ start:524 stop:1162 length:639 start_codon:yes stop_codon:yes gene_type:complete